MNKRVLQQTKRGIALFLLFILLFSTDAVAQAASASKTMQNVREAGILGAKADDDVYKSAATKPAVTDKAVVSATPAATNTTTAPAVTQTPVVTEMPANPPEQSQSPVIRPKKISKIYLCSLGKHKVKLTWKRSAYAERYEIYRKKKGSGTYRLLGTGKECSYTDKKVSYNQVYRYRVIPVAGTEGEKLAGKGTCVTFRNGKIVAVDHQKYRYSEMAADIKLLAKNYHGLVQYQVIGKSEDGRNIYDVILGNPEASKTLLVVSTLHAREYMASLLCMNQIEYYLQSYQGKVDGKKVKNTLNNIAIHYIPMANPDGVTISQSGLQKIRSASLRKKLKKCKRGSTKRWKANARGVDLNRNFPYLFIKAGKRGSEGYTGPYAASESETVAIVKRIDQLKTKTRLQGVINYHAMGSIVFGDCQKSGSFVSNTRRMYRLARKTTGYGSAAGYQGATSQGRGCLREYVMYGLSIPSITLEIGKRTCPGPVSEFPSIWRKNRKLVLQEARLFI